MLENATFRRLLVLCDCVCPFIVLSNLWTTFNRVYYWRQFSAIRCFGFVLLTVVESGDMVDQAFRTQATTNLIESLFWRRMFREQTTYSENKVPTGVLSTRMCVGFAYILPESKECLNDVCHTTVAITEEWTAWDSTINVRYVLSTGFRENF